MSDTQPSPLQGTISEATKTAMKARDKERVAVLRMVNAEIKRYEVDERKTPTDDVVLGILNRMLKQRTDSQQAFEAAGRDELAAREVYESEVIREFMPAPLSAAEIDAAIAAAIEQTGASGMPDMGKVMGVLQGPLRGKADMGQVSAQVKARLAG